MGMQRLLKVRKQRRKQQWKKKRRKKRRRRKKRSKYHSHKHSQSLICQSIPDWIWRSSCRHQTDICDFPVQVVDPMKNINRLCIFTSQLLGGQRYNRCNKSGFIFGMEAMTRMEYV